MKPTNFEIEIGQIPPPPAEMIASVLTSLQGRIEELTVMTAPTHPEGHTFISDANGQCTECAWIDPASQKMMKCGKHTLRDHALQALEQFSSWEKDLQDPKTSGISMLEILAYVSS